MSALFSKLRRTFILGGTALLVSLPHLPPAAAAEEKATGPVQILVAYAPGGGTDTLARILAVPLATVLNRPVTVQNLPGGGGQVAATTLLRDGADGSAILATNEPDLIMSTVFNKAPYKAADFQAIMVDVRDPRVMLVQKSSELNSFSDFVSRAKAEPGKLAVAVAQGSAQELLAKWLFGKLGLQIRVVGYPGGGNAANALLAGDVVAAIGDDFARLNVRDKTKALFVGAADKSPRWPEAATLAEALAPHGVTLPAKDFLARYGVYVVSTAFKAKHPEAYAALQKALLEARETPEFKSYIAKNAIEDLSVGRPGEALQADFEKSFAEIAKLK
jgi:tripartite-type tricarboxylate transporter receptor subunit TctC